MEYREEKIGDVLIIRILQPRLDTDIAPELKTEILRLIEQVGEHRILIDLKEVDYVDSSGLGALLFAARQTKAKSGMLRLVNSNQKFLNLIRIAKLDSVIVNYNNEGKAIKSFQEEYEQ
ncbi:MAG: STAS domain-containing protein [bacterium]